LRLGKSRALREITESLHCLCCIVESFGLGYREHSLEQDSGKSHLAGINSLFTFSPVV